MLLSTHEDDSLYSVYCACIYIGSDDIQMFNNRESLSYATKNILVNCTLYGHDLDHFHVNDIASYIDRTLIIFTLMDLSHVI